MQVTVVDAHQRSIEGLQCALQLVAVMHFDQHVQADAFGHGRQLGHLHVIQCRDNQQHAVGTQGTSFDDLVRVDHEILADHRQLARSARLLQERVGTLEVVNIRQHRQAGCPTLLVTDGDLSGYEVFANHAFARRGFLDLGDHGRLLELGLGDQGIGKAAWRLGAFRLRFQLGQAHTGAALGHFFSLAGQDLFQNGWHTHPSFSILNTAVNAPSSSSFSRARPVCSASWAKATPSLRL